MNNSQEMSSGACLWQRLRLKELDWHALSSCRDFLYGFAILYIMLFHSMRILRDNGELSSSLGLLARRLLGFGNIGVEVFLCLSGISLYFAMQKKPTLRQFYSRRMQRVILPYLLVAIPWNLWRVFATEPFSGLSIWKRLGTAFINLFGMDLALTGYNTFWYVYAIILCYIAYPFLYRLFLKFNWSFVPPLLLTMACFGFNALVSKMFPVFYSRMEILLQRFPIFVLGSYLGKFVYEKRPVKVNPWLLFWGMGILFLAVIRSCEVAQAHHIVFLNLRVEYFLATLPLLYLLTGAALLLHDTLLYKALTFLAPITLELYLTHAKFYKIMGELPGLRDHLWIVHAIALPIAILFALALLRFEKWLLKRLNEASSSAEPS